MISYSSVLMAVQATSPLLVVVDTTRMTVVDLPPDATIPMTWVLFPTGQVYTYTTLYSG